MIEFKNVTKIYKNGVKALHNVSFKIEKGEFVFIIGHTGSGKTTLLKHIYRELKPTHGEVYVDDKLLNKLKQNEVSILRRKMGIVFQDFKLLSYKTIFENIAYALEVLEEEKQEIYKKVRRILTLVGLEQKANFYPDELSGGEQQRVSLARALVNNPLYLIADEPTGNLDPRTALDIIEIIKKANEMGTTVIIATHDAVIVNKLKKRVITLYEGGLVSDIEKGTYLDYEKEVKLLS